MIEFTTGNIINADADALVNTINIVGVMGKGIALAFKKSFPTNFTLYKEACETEEIQIGKIFITETNQFNPKFIFNFPTKKHWRNRSEIEYIEKGLEDLRNCIIKYQIKSIAIPPLGCGNGGLDWKTIKPLILESLKDIPECKISIYEPGFKTSQPAQKPLKLTPARAMFFKALNDYQVLDYEITLLVAQKIAYFLQRLGEPLKLKYEKAQYGPYSNNLQHLLKFLNGSFLTFEHESVNPFTLVQINHYTKINEYVENELSPEQKNRLLTLRELIEDFESPYGLELLATIDFIHEKMDINDTPTISTEIKSWTRRKEKIMKPHHIEVVHQRLKEFYEQGKL